MGCSRQSINFYILGKRFPDIILAGKMAKSLGVSCDYLIGTSDYKGRKDAEITTEQVGIAPDVMKFFGGLKIMSEGKFHNQREYYDKLEFSYEKEVLPYNMIHSKQLLDLLNSLIAHDAFGQLLNLIKKYSDISNRKDTMVMLQDFMIEIESPVTGIKYGTKEENEKMAREFCLYVINQSFDNIVRDICK